MNTTYLETVDVAFSSDYGRNSDYDAASTEPLEVLTQDVARLSNCLKEYRHRLTESLTESENSRAFAGIRISLTTLTLFGMVAAFALALNLMLRTASASTSQILQANVAMGVLYLCVAVSALNDLARGRLRWRTEREALQLRTQDITQQFEELNETRLVWVQELTRSQWTSETEKLKLQLVQQELATKQTAFEQCDTALTHAQDELDLFQKRSATLQAEIAVANDRLKRAEQDASKSQSEKEQLDKACEQLLQQSNRLQTELESQRAAVNLSSAQLQSQTESIQQLTVQATELALQHQQQRTDYSDEVQLLQSEIATNEAVLLEQKHKLAAAEAKLASTQASLAEAESACEAGTLQRMDVQSAISEQNAALLTLQNLTEQRSNELQRIQGQCETTIEQLTGTEAKNRAFEALIVEAKAELETIRSACDAERAEVANLEAQLGALQTKRAALSEQLSSTDSEIAEQKAAVAHNQLELDKIAAQTLDQLTQLSACQEEEQRARSHVDWLLSQVGEFERLTAAQMAAKQLTDEELACVKHLITAGQEELRAVTENIAALRSQVATEQQAIEHSGLQFASLVAEMESASAQKLANEQLARDAQQHAESLLDKAEAMATQIERRAEELHLTQQSIAKLKVELQSLEQRKASYDRLQVDSAELVQRIADQRELADTLEQHVSDGELRVHSLKQAIAEHTETLETLTAKIDERTTERALQESKLTLIAEETEHALQVQMRVQQQLQAASEQLSDKQSTVNELSIEIESAVRERDLLTAEFQATQAQLQRLQLEADQRQHEYTALMQASLETSELSAQASVRLQSLESQIASAKDRESEQVEQIDRLNSQHVALSTTLAQLTNEVQEAEGIASQWRTYLDQLKSERQRLDQEISLLSKNVDTLTSQLQERQAKLDNFADLSRDASQRYEQTITATRETESLLSTLRSEIQRDESRRAQMQADIARAQDLLGDYARQLDAANDRLAEAESQLRITEDEQHERQQELDRIDSSKAATQRAFDQLQYEHNVLENQTAELTARSAELSHTICDCEKQLVKAAAEFDQLQNQRATAQDEVARLGLELSERSAEIEARSRELKTLEKSCTAQQSAVDQLELRQHTLQLQLDGLTSEISQQQALERTFSTDNLRAQSDIEQLQQQRADMQAAVDALAAESLMKQQDLAESAARVEELRAKHAELLHDSDCTQANLAQYGSEEHAARQRLSELTVAVEDRQRELRNCHAQLERFQQQQTALETRIANQSLESEKLDQRLQETLATVASVELRIDSSRAAKLALENSIKEVNSERNEIVRELQSFEAECTEAKTIRGQLVLQRDTLHQLLERVSCRTTEMNAQHAELTEDIQNMRIQISDLQAARAALEADRQQAEMVASSTQADSEPGEVSEIDSIRTKQQPTLALEEDIWSTVKSLEALTKGADAPARQKNVFAGAVSEPTTDLWSFVTSKRI